MCDAQLWNWRDMDMDAKAILISKLEIRKLFAKPKLEWLFSKVFTLAVCVDKRIWDLRFVCVWVWAWGWEWHIDDNRRTITIHLTLVTHTDTQETQCRTCFGTATNPCVHKLLFNVPIAVDKGLTHTSGHGRCLCSSNTNNAMWWLKRLNYKWAGTNGAGNELNDLCAFTS